MEGRQFLLIKRNSLQANQDQSEIEDLTANFDFFPPYFIIVCKVPSG